MNPLVINPTPKDKVVDVRQVEVNKKRGLTGRIPIKKGHTLFEINLKEKTIKVAQFEDKHASFIDQVKTQKSDGFKVVTYKNGHKKIVLDKLPVKSKVLIKKPDCIYLPALNLKNIHNKLEKMGIIRVVRKSTLKEAIEKAKPSMDKIEDVDDFLDSIK